ncbi:MAG TPA: hypothetical protein VII34_04930 [Pyrinomonadaceae bacterium]
MRISASNFVAVERQGQTARHNLFSHREIIDTITLFWAEQYDLGIA